MKFAAQHHLSSSLLLSGPEMREMIEKYCKFQTLMQGSLLHSITSNIQATA